MEGYSDSRGTLLSRGRATPLSLLVMSALALAACGGGGGGGGGGSSNPPANQAPTANAGADKTGNFPEAVSLDGTGTDPENATLTYAWSATPVAPAAGTATFTAANAADTNVTFSEPGTYTVTLSVNDGTNAAVTDSATVTVTATYPSTTAWTTATPADVGLTTAKLDEARDYSLQPNPEAIAGGSGVVIRYGKLVYSWGDTTARYDLKSTTKSMGGLTLFTSLAENKVTLSGTAQQVLGSVFAQDPSTNNSVHPDWVQTITIQQLATHTAGFEKPDANRDANNDNVDDSPQNDGALVAAPATQWRYSDAGLNWLADVLTAANQDDLFEVAKDKIFTPIGITTGGTTGLTWRTNLSRVTPFTVGGGSYTRRELAAGIASNVDAMARVGYLMLRKGKWNDTQVVPADMVALAHTPQTSAVQVANDQLGVFTNANEDYGVLWWTNASGEISGLPTDAYWSWGLGESLIVVIPSLDLVIARAGPQPIYTGTVNRQWNYGWDGDYSVLAPFLRPFAEAAATP